MNILLTGGAGYIGSHTAVALTQAGHRVVLLDNYANSRPEVGDRLARILGQPVAQIECDVRDTARLTARLRQYAIEAVIHFAGLKAVAESVAQPLDYYAHNVQGAISLLQAMQAAGVRTLVFSSSATVYGEPQYLPIDESHPLAATNPYGRTKLHIEAMLGDIARADPAWRIACLRYFNPVGAHESGLIGEDPRGVPNNLMPFIAQVASGAQPWLNIFGNRPAPARRCRRLLRRGQPGGPPAGLAGPARVAGDVRQRLAMANSLAGRCGSATPFKNPSPAGGRGAGGRFFFQWLGC